MNAMGINCEVTTTGQVIPNPGYEGPPTSNGPYHGSCAFDWLEGRGTELPMVIARKVPEAAARAAATRPRWVPNLGVTVITEDGAFAQIQWLVTPEPEPGHYQIVHGVGNLYYPVIEVSGEEVFAQSVLAGAHGSEQYRYSDHAAVPPYALTASLYSDSTRSRLITSSSSTFSP